METKERGRHRLGGKHSDPILVPTNRKPRGAHAAPRPVVVAAEEPEIIEPGNVVEPIVEVAAPPKPDHAPIVHARRRVSSHAKAYPVVVPDMDVMDTKKALATDTPGRISIVKHKSKITALTAIATGGLLIIGGSSGATVAPEAKKTDSASDLERESTISDPITVPLDVLLTQEKIEVKTEAAPIPEPVIEEAAPVIVEPEPVPLPPPAPAKHVAPAPPAAVVAPTPSVKAGIIASSALAQVGRIQDCTMLVTNSLAVAGVQFHDWPIGYFSLGRTVSPSQAIPGDLLYYDNGGGGVPHIAVYIGNGQAVHGGWNGNQTVVFSANVGSGPTYIRVTA